MSQQIQCPACRRKFQAHGDLTGKTVECGACDHRFSVSSTHIIENRKKFYPGEQTNAGLDRFGSSHVRENVPVTFQTASYTEQVSADAVQSASPGQSFAVFTGLSLIIGFTILFPLISGEGQALTDVDLFRRLTLGGFITLIGSTLIIYGAKNWRGRGILLSVLLSLGLIGLILILPVHLTPTGARDELQANEKSTSESTTQISSDEQSEEAEYLSKIGHSKVIEFIRRNTDEDQGLDGRQRVVAIYAHPVTDSSYFPIESYLKRRLSLDSDVPIYRYKRNDGKDSLIVIAGIRINFDLVAEAAEQLGAVATLPNRRLIDLSVNKSIFSAPSPEEMRKLTENDHELFCISNLNEMDHPDLDRVTSAVQRLAKIPDGVKMRYKPKIASRLATLIATEQDEKLIEEAGAALIKWGKNDPAIVKNLTNSAITQLESGKSVPRSLVNFLIENKSDQSLLIVDQMWAKNPNRWSEQYVKLGAAGEDRLLYHLQSSPAQLKNNAVVLLKRIGTEKSVPLLKKSLRGTNDGFDISVQRAIDSIENR
ncbi:hypothetical protein OAG53_01160 [Akkermansiaceae bacterium]|nr:hypothetical protein [Akkermansiaceae bacterium]